ncbi:MAG: HAD family hydrolase [Betaproteobacteria bacterium]
MKKIYFFDIDNTLIDHKTFSIPASALSAIAGLKQSGHTIALATGRSYAHAKAYVDQLQPDYVITQNGARAHQGEQEIVSIPLARAPLVELFEWIEGLGHAFGVNDDDSGFISNTDPRIVAPLTFVGMPFQTHDRFYLHRDTFQGWLFFEESHDAQLMPEILERFPDFALARWHPMGVDVMPRAINKWTGCQKVIAHAGFRIDQSIAFGDGLNDLEMIQGAGVGIAMDNGHPQLKAIADRIAPALHLDGIAMMLNELQFA